MANDSQSTGSSSEFQATIASEIQQLQRSNWQALEGWYGRYKPPLVTHLRHKFQLEPEQAESIFHDFLHDKIIQKEIIGQYDFDRGKKFRNFILKALTNYVKDWFKKQNRLSLRDPDDALLTSAVTTTDADVDRDWARALLATAADRLKTHYETRGQAERWLIFEQRILLPRLTGAAPATVGALMDQFQLQSPAEVSQRLVRAKETFERLLHQTICESADDRVAAQLELNQLKQIWQSGS